MKVSFLFQCLNFGEISRFPAWGGSQKHPVHTGGLDQAYAQYQPNNMLESEFKQSFINSYSNSSMLIRWNWGAEVIKWLQCRTHYYRLRSLFSVSSGAFQASSVPLHRWELYCAALPSARNDLTISTYISDMVSHILTFRPIILP